MKTIRKCKPILLLMLLVVCFSFTITVNASDEVIIDGSKLTNDTETTGEYQNVLRGAILNNGRVTLSNNGNRQISCYGSTACLRICDKVELEVYLERSSGGSWNSYKNWKYSTTNDAILSRTNTLTVPGGYYYRLRGYHACEKSGYGRESNSSFTNGIWIS